MNSFYCPSCADSRASDTESDGVLRVLAEYQVDGTIYCRKHAVRTMMKKSREGSAYRITGKELPQ